MTASIPGAVYDLVEYPSKPIAECHPVRMASIAALGGLTPPDVAGATLVDLGCGTAANLLAIAAAYPGVRAIGVDPSSEAIASGQRLVDDADLTNVELVADVRAPLGGGEADFVIAHGVLSWVDGPTRDAVISEAARITRDGGLVMLSYNAEPGALPRMLPRWIGRRVAERKIAAADPTAAKATLLERLDLAAAYASGGDPYAQFAASQRRYVEQRVAGALFHDELGDEWTPIAVEDLAAQALRHGLDYVGELRAADRWRTWSTVEQVEQIAQVVGPSAAAAQQYLDDLTGASFHDSLFVKGSAPAPPVRDGGAAPPPAWPPERWHVRPHGAKAPAGVSGVDATVAEIVRAAGSRGLPLSDVAVHTGLAPATMLAAASRLDARDLVTLALMPLPAADAAPQCPVVSALARAQARCGHQRITSLRHRSVVVEDAPLRLLLPLLDGTRDRTALAEHVHEAGYAGGDDAAALVEHCLAALARSGFIARDAAAASTGLKT